MNNCHHTHRPLQIIARRLLTGRGTTISHRSTNRVWTLATVTAASPSFSNIPARRSFSNTTYNPAKTNDNNNDNNNDDDDYLDDYLDDDTAAAATGAPKTALVVGSSGALGRCVVRHLSETLGIRVVGADVVHPRSAGDEAHLTGGFVALPTLEHEHEHERRPAPLVDLTVALADGLHQLLGGGGELDAVICVAGGWEGDPAPLEPEDGDDELDDDVDAERSLLAAGAHSYASTIDRMVGQNLNPVLAAGYAAQHFLTAGNANPSERGGGNDALLFQDEDEDDGTRREGGGLFVAIGATVALGGTPGMMGYGISKAATHHFVRTLGEATGKAVTSKASRRRTRELRLGSRSRSYAYLNKLTVVGILPTTLDTPANREAMPSGDFEQWTKPADVAREIGVWLEEPALRPHSGSLVKVHPKRDGTGAEFRLAR